MDQLNNKSPLRYPGGKTKAVKKLDVLLQNNTDLSKYKNLISPFFGGGSFEFYLQNKYKLFINANDKFTPLLTFWLKAQNNKEEICKKLSEDLNITKENFFKYRKCIMELKDTNLIALYYFIINRCSYNGTTLSGGFSLEASKKRFTKSSIKRIEKLNLDFVKFTNLDFTDFLMNFDNNEENIYFLDPPYYLTTKLYGNNGDMQEYFDHQRLQKILKSKNNWILCYNDCEYIRNLYKDYKIIDLDWKYGMNKSKKSSEIVIVKFD